MIFFCIFRLFSRGMKWNLCFDIYVELCVVFVYKKYIDFLIMVVDVQGGLVKVGFDVVQMWLDGNEILVNIIDWNGFIQFINLVNGYVFIYDFLVVLVNEGSVSVSEILVGVLYDNGCVVFVGINIFGKGKIQVSFFFLFS